MTISRKHSFTPSLEALETRELMTAGMGLIVPAYQYPTAGRMWADLTAAAAKVPVMAIVNPNSGPGSLDDRADYLPAVDRLRAAGGSAIGYVHTRNLDNSLRPVAAVELEMKTYRDYGYNLNGIFIDEMSPGNLTYYQALYTYAKGLQSGWTVVGNPGTIPEQTYATAPVADTLVLFENDLTDPQGEGYDHYTAPAWQTTLADNHFANIVHDAPTVADMQQVVAKASAQHTGWVYVTDATAHNNADPYDRLPTYWNQLIAALPAAASSPLSLNPAALAAGTARTPYNQSIVVSGGTGAYTQLTVSRFNPGTTGLAAPAIDLGRRTVTLAGTPRAAGTVTFTVTVRDTAGATLSQTFAVTINAPLTITTQLLSPANLSDSLYYSKAITTQGGTGAKTFAVTAGSLPPGLRLNTGTGTISGRPRVFGTFQFTVRATDATGATAFRTFTLAVVWRAVY